jgi:hypothetical protein
MTMNDNYQSIPSIYTHLPTSTMASPTPISTQEEAYEELDLDDEPLTPTIKQEPTHTKASPSNSFSSSNQYTSPTSRDEDPWRSSIPSSSSASRLSSSTAGLTSPPTLERTSRASSMSGSSGAAILGIAVVDFNHLVSWTGWEEATS